MANTRTDTAPLRVFLWAIPRTLSTVFQKCLAHVQGIQIISEPFSYAYYMGPESKVWKNEEVGGKTSKALDKGDDLGVTIKPGWFHESICTYQWAKDTLEANYPGKSIIFCKEVGLAITGNLDMMPSGFRHTFLIRHPHKVFPSWKKMNRKFLQLGEDYRFQDLPEPYCPTKFGYGELYDLVQHVKHVGEPDPVIIDADDLQRSPATILRQYCLAIGIPFTDGLIQWPAGITILDDWIVNSTFAAVSQTDEGGFYDAAFKSTHFLPPSKIPSREDLADDLLPVVDASMPYYEKLYEMRIRP